ncbi:MAG: efflux RND transporter periplasmic adaptor subunit [Myxococcota bacterium]
MLAAFGLLLSACADQPAPPGKPKGALAFPVEVIEVAARPVEYGVRAVGSVEAFERVQVTARVAGVVEKVRFAEGQTAKEGDVLVEIDPHRHRLSVRAAEAALAKAAAAKADAEAGLSRREAVEKANPGLIRGEELETWRTRALTAAAEHSAARVAWEQAQLNLRDAYVRAPVVGVLQTRSVQTGQYVQPGTVLATLVRREPLLLRFRVPEPDAARFSAGMAAHFQVRGVGENLEARITHVADLAEEGSRMVAVTAEVEDHRKDQLRPGAFAEVTVPVPGGGAAPVIPQTAVRPSERGFLAYVVEGEVAKERVLTLGLRTAEGLVEVKDGVKAGELLAVRGTEALREGAPVRVTRAGELPDAGGGDASLGGVR